MDRALDAAIRLFTRTLDDAGIDAGGLAIRGAVPTNVSALLADCTTGEDDGGLTYLALGITPDFKQHNYLPHGQLFFILNATGICEHPAAQAMLNAVAPGQLPSPLIDAHLLRHWIRYILPTGQAMFRGAEAQEELLTHLMDELMSVVRHVPPEFAERFDLEKRFRDWASGFPGVISQRLDSSVQRMNGLPVTPFIHDVLTREFVRLQTDGLNQRG